MISDLKNNFLFLITTVKIQFNLLLIDPVNLNKQTNFYLCICGKNQCILYQNIASVKT